VPSYVTAPPDHGENFARRPRRRRGKRAQCVKLAISAIRLRLRRRCRQKITSYRLVHERLVAFIVSIRRRRVGRGRLDEERSETSARPRINAIYVEISSGTGRRSCCTANSRAGMTSASMYASSDVQSVDYVHPRLSCSRGPHSAPTATELRSWSSHRVS